MGIINNVCAEEIKPRTRTNKLDLIFFPANKIIEMKVNNKEAKF
jgi:hypothetical protein